MVSILSTYENIREEYRKVSIHTYGVERDQLPQLEKELGEKPNTATWWNIENTTGRFFQFRRIRILFEKNSNDDASAVMVPSEKLFRQR